MAFPRFACHDLEVARVADGRDQVAVDGLFDGTVRFVRVRTVGKAAARDERPEFDEEALDLFGPHVPELHLADARRVDHPAAEIELRAERPSASCGGPCGSSR